MTRKCFGILSAALVLSFATTGVRAQGPREGITVHGHWVLEVRNADGAPVERREFENALADNGDDFLGYLLVREVTMGPWTLWLEPAMSGGPWGANSGVIHEPAYPASVSTNFFPTLVLAGDSQEDDCELANGARVVLCGTATAGQTGTLTDVRTFARVCAPSATPAACGSGAAALSVGFSFTRTAIKSGVPPVATPLTLVKGQILQVKVYISFTSAS